MVMGLSGGMSGMGYMRSRSPADARGRSKLMAAAQNQLVGTGAGGGAGGGTGGGGSRASTGGGGGGGGGANTSFQDTYNKILARLEPGGKTLEADFADIEAGKQAAIARGEQNLVSGGLSGTTVMAGVPIAAEKGAASARLRARGGAEDKYLNALTSFANLAFQAEEGRLNRASSAANRGSGPAVQWPTAPVGGPGYVASRQPSANVNPQVGGNNADQFPSLYGSGGQLPSTPDWTGGGGNAAPYSGGYTSTSLSGMTSQELDRYYGSF